MQWLTDYLTDRKQKVKLSDVISTVRNVNYGIPQGYVLGTLLFILYINYISNATSCDFINLFADDTLLAGYDG